MASQTESLPDALLEALAEKGRVDSYEYATSVGRNHQDVVGAVKSLESFGDILKTEQKQTELWELTEEGKEIAENGSHEVRLFEAVDQSNGTPQNELMSKVPNAKIGFSKAMSNKWLKLDKSSPGPPQVYRNVESVTDTVRKLLCSLKGESGRGELSDENLKEFKKRKLISSIIIKNYIITQGPSFTTSISKKSTELTAEMIQNGSWKNEEFKSYNFNALGAPLATGHLHPLLKVRTEIRQIFLEMGFCEMPTNNFIESSFWNFDALFQPQQHPARDAHDTFFLKDPQFSYDFPTEYLERVKTMHQTGGHGSIGYQYDWKLEEAQKNILRTHTTAVSTRMLYKLGQQVGVVHSNE
uniref:Phenylalanyl-tRNA synthetase domain-containing protein n=2 Tax=Amphimedon queenslandica TaxID=400682 RepID=A0A1X7TUQ5_AMPQE